MQSLVQSLLMEPLLLFAEVAGMFVLVASFVLLYKRIILIDSTTRQPIQIELPFLGKLKTQSPLVFMLGLGAALIFYPATKSLPEAEMEGTVDTGKKTVTMLIVAVPTYTLPQDAPGHVQARIPLLPNVHYRVKYVVDKQIVEDRELLLRNGVLSMGEFKWIGPPEKGEKEEQVYQPILQTDPNVLKKYYPQ